jgi:thiamine biosynthesis lipoprotein
MFPQIARHVGIMTLLAAPLAAAPNDTSQTPRPIRMSMPAFGVQAQVEVRDLLAKDAEAAVQAALTEIHQVAQLADGDGETPLGAGALNRAAGQATQDVDERLAELLLRSLQFCIWTQGAYGPLGGGLYDLWAEQQDGRSRPLPSDLHKALGAAECNRVLLNDLNQEGPGKRATLTVGSKVDFRGIERGFAVDRAVDVLKARGVNNAWVSVGNAWRGMGDGPDGLGWPDSLPPAPGKREPIDELWLQDQALVFLSIEPFGGEPFVPVVDQRTGVPARGVVTVVVVTEQAVDAEPLAAALFIFGHREGLQRLGALDPRPSVYWLLGEGRGEPLAADYRWSSLERVRRR